MVSSDTCWKFKETVSPLSFHKDLHVWWVQSNLCKCFHVSYIYCTPIKNNLPLFTRFCHPNTPKTSFELKKARSCTGVPWYSSIEISGSAVSCSNIRSHQKSSDSLRTTSSFFTMSQLLMLCLDDMLQVK